MAKSEITVSFDPQSIKELADSLRRAFQAARDQGGMMVLPNTMEWIPRTATQLFGVEPVVIKTPEGEKVMLVDDFGEAHWMMNTSSLQMLAEERGWRQVFVKKVSQ